MASRFEVNAITGEKEEFYQRLYITSTGCYEYLDSGSDTPDGWKMLTDDEALEYILSTSMESYSNLVATPRQIRQALNACGMRKTVDDGIAAAGQDIKDWWEFSTSFERNHPVITGTAASLGISSSQLEDIFALAVTL
jgi:hypothetical protein